MNEWIQADRRIGMWSATIAAMLGLVFVIVGLIGIVARPPSSEALHQVDPYLAILEILMILFAVVLVVTMAAIQACATPDRKTLSLIALAFTICFAALTCGVHFARLTLGRQTDPDALPLLSHQLSTGDWPTLADVAGLARMGLLSWAGAPVCLGLALLFAARVFRGETARGIRICMTVAGMLCLAGTIGPVSGHMHIQYLGIAGYAFVLPVACALLAVFFWRGRTSESG